MTDLLTAANNAVFAALNVAQLTDLCPIFTNVPANQSPPFAAIGSIDAEAGDTKLDGLERLTLEVEFQHRGASKLPLYAMMHAVRELLATAALIAEGAALHTPSWLASATDREDDGVTYHGIHSFEIYAQATD